jgi:general secretion pathway protein K
MVARTSQGFILVAVLWTIALLAALAIATSLSFRALATMTALNHDSGRADALLQAGLDLGADVIRQRGALPLSPQTRIATLGQGTLRVDLSDDGGRIDINAAPREVLTSLFRSVGVSRSQADLLAGEIDALRKPKGAGATQAQSPAQAQPAQSNSASQPPASAAAPSPQGVATDSFQAFTDIRQLTQIPGITEEQVRALAPLATVFGDDKINALTAPPDVLAALPGMNASMVQAILALRDHPASADAQLHQMAGQAGTYLKSKSRPIARIALTVLLPDGYMKAARAVIVVLPRDSEPYRVLEWTPLAPPSHV